MGIEVILGGIGLIVAIVIGIIQISQGRKQIERGERGTSPPDPPPSGGTSVDIGTAGHDAIIANRDVIIQQTPPQPETEPPADEATPAPTRALHIISAPKPEILVGRDDLLKQCRTLIAGKKSILLHGLGGMGKTSVAWVLAKEHRDAHGNDSLVWLNVLERSIEDLLTDVWRALHDQDLPPGELEDQGAMVRNALSTRPDLLIVLDDVTVHPNKDNTARQWQRYAQPDGAALLATGRTEFTGFDENRAVAELSPGDAKAVLLFHMGNKKETEVDTDQLTNLCEAVGRHALALTLLGETIQREYGTDLQAAHRDLADPERRETVRELLQSEAADNRYNSVFLSMELTWNRLSEDEKHLLTRLAAMFDDANGAGDELLQLATGFDNDAYRKTHVALKNRSLLREPLPGRRALHPLVKTYIEALTVGKEWQAVRQAAVDACVTYAKAHNQKNREAHDLLDAELANLLGAAAYAAEHNLHEAVNRLAWDMWGNSEFMTRRGYWRAAIPLLEAGIQAARALDNRRDEGAQHGNLGGVYLSLGQYEKALEHYQQDLAIAREIGDRAGEGSALGNLGIVYDSLGQYEKAIEHYQQHLDIAREIGDRAGQGRALGNLGVVYRRLGQYEKALDHYQQHLDIAREIGDRAGEGSVLGNLGVVYRNLGQYEKAIAHYQQSLDVARKIGDRRGEAIVLFNMGLLYEKQEEVKQAVEHLEQSRAVFEALGLEADVADCDEALARLRGT